jgi:uncharacterized Zn finger protein
MTSTWGTYGAGRTDGDVDMYGEEDVDGDADGHGEGNEVGQRGGGERVFAALPPARGRAFARTWWGTRWLKALEDTALDSQQLRLGRRFARQGAVGAVSVRPGRITAVVRGRDGAPQRADVLLREFTGSEWERLLEIAGRESGHVAALLDGELPPRLVEDAESAGVELLPGIGDLDASCDCGAWDHCLHAAALCYQTARLLDEDPFVLLLLRGRTEGVFLDGLGLRGGGAPAAAPLAGSEIAGPAETGTEGSVTPGGPGPVEGSGSSTSPGPEPVRADEAFAARPLRPPLPYTAESASEPFSEPGAPLSLDDGTPPGPPELDLAAMEFLAADAARRAHRMLRKASSPSHAGTEPPGELTRRQDAVRLAAQAPGERVTRRLAAACRLSRGDLSSAVRAWETGGTEALSVWEEPWTPGPQAAVRMRRALASALAGRQPDAEPEPHFEANRWCSEDGSAQLRYGRDGRWWPYRRDTEGGWRPAGGPEQDPAAALAVAAGEDEPGRDGRG